jgi:predicted Zn-dependent peptidase
VVRDGQTPSACEAAFDAVMDDALQNNVTEEELLKVKKQARASFAYRTETVTSQAFSYARAENFDSYKWVDQYTERIEAVTLGDLHDVACCYLTRHNRRGGAFDPTRNEA